MQTDPSTPNNVGFAQGLRASWRLVSRATLSRDKTSNFGRDLTSILLTSGVLNAEGTKLSMFVCTDKKLLDERQTNF